MPVSSIDVFPTLLEAAETGAPDSVLVDGISLMPLLKGRGGVRREPLFWHFPHYRGGLGPYAIIRAGDWKLIKRYDKNSVELFDLRSDPGEQCDLALQLPEVAESQARKLEDWQARIGARMPRVNPDFNRQ